MSWRSTKIERQALEAARQGNRYAARGNRLAALGVAVAVAGVAVAVIVALRRDSSNNAEAGRDGVVAGSEVLDFQGAFQVDSAAVPCVSSYWFAEHDEASPEDLSNWLIEHEGRSLATEWMESVGGQVQPSERRLALTNTADQPAIVSSVTFRTVTESSSDGRWAIWRDGGDCGGDDGIPTLHVSVSRTGIETVAQKTVCDSQCVLQDIGPWAAEVPPGQTILAVLMPEAFDGNYELVGEISYVMGGEFHSQQFLFDGAPLTVQSLNSTDLYHVECQSNANGVVRSLAAGDDPHSSLTCWGGLGGP